MQSRTKSGSINDLKVKPFQPSSYPQRRIKEPTMGWPIKEFFSREEKKKLRVINKGMRAKHHTKIEIESILQNGKIDHKVLLRE